jgi:hypothetical protein
LFFDGDLHFVPVGGFTASMSIDISLTFRHGG